MEAREFEVEVSRFGGQVGVALPFDPNQVWGRRARHDVAGTVNGARWRGRLREQAGAYFMSLGAAFRRDTGLDVGHVVRVEVAPEGPQMDNLGADLAAALEAEPEARSFFESIPTFYRRNYVRWIETAKRPETRANRVRETVELLKQGRRQR